MNKEEILKELELTPEEIKELIKKQKNKANNLLLRLINENNEVGAMFLVFDQAFKQDILPIKNPPEVLIEVNADMHYNNYTPLMLAIKNSMVTLVKDSFLSPDIKHKLNLNRKNNKELYENLAQCTKTELYDFLEDRKENKEEMLSDTLYYALGFGNLNMIKHLINKKVNGVYQPVNFGRAILGYDSNDTYNDDDRWDKLYEYANYFANIEKYTNNTYINEESKEIFFNSRLLLRIILKNDDRNLQLYKETISEEQFKKDIVSMLNAQQDQIEKNESRIVEGIKWLLMNNEQLDLSTQKSIKKCLKINNDLLQIYDKVILNKKLNNALGIKEIKTQTNKI